MREHLVRELTCFIKIVAVDNDVNKLWVYDHFGRKHEMPIPDSPTVHSFLGDLMLLRSIGAGAIIERDKKLLGLSADLNNTVDSGSEKSITPA